MKPEDQPSTSTDLREVGQSNIARGTKTPIAIVIGSQGRSQTSRQRKVRANSELAVGIPLATPKDVISLF